MMTVEGFAILHSLGQHSSHAREIVRMQALEACLHRASGNSWFKAVQSASLLGELHLILNDVPFPTSQPRKKLSFSQLLLDKAASGDKFTR